MTLDAPHCSTVLAALARDGANPGAVVRCWEEGRRGGEGLVPFLARRGVLRDGAERSLLAVAKGYLSLDPGVLVVPGAWRRLCAEPAAPKTDVVAVAADGAGAPSGPAPAPHERVGRRMGTRIGRCLLVRVLGEGGSGTVYQALHSKLDIPVAVKVLGGGPVGGAPLNLRKEAAVLARLNHPNVVRVFDYEDEGDDPHLVLELVDGCSLSELIGLSGGLQIGRAARVVADAACGLMAALRFGIVHRDVKPANVLVARDGQVKVTDFGLATAADRAAGGSGERGLVGTVAYMAPELFSGRRADFRSDQYALGATLFEAAVGRRPFAAATALELMLQHAEEPVPPAHEMRPGLPAELSAVVARMMAKSPAERFPSYEAILGALSELARLDPEQSTHPTWRLATHAPTG